MVKDEYQNIGNLRSEASALIDQRYFEDAISKLNQCLELEDDPSERGTILCDLGYCFIMLGWYHESVKIYVDLLEESPWDNDARFYLSSAYASMGWIDESIGGLKKILASDPTDVLAYHDLGLCYRDKGWLKESFETLQVAKQNSLAYGNQEERDLIEQTLANLEKEIGKGEEDKLRKTLLLAVLLVAMKRKKKKAL